MRILLVLVLSVAFGRSAVAAQIGAPAPPLRLEDDPGSSSLLDRHRGSVIIVVFWAPWCASCIDELSGLQQVYAKYRKQGFIVIGIQVDGSRSGTERVRNRLALSFPLFRDAHGNTAAAFGVSGLPASFLIGKDGGIRRSYRGFERSMITRIETDISSQLNE